MALYSEGIHANVNYGSHATGSAQAQPIVAQHLVNFPYRGTRILSQSCRTIRQQSHSDLLQQGVRSSPLQIRCHNCNWTANTGPVATSGSRTTPQRRQD